MRLLPPQRAGGPARARPEQLLGSCLRKSTAFSASNARRGALRVADDQHVPGGRLQDRRNRSTPVRTMAARTCELRRHPPRRGLTPGAMERARSPHRTPIVPRPGLPHRGRVNQSGQVRELQYPWPIAPDLCPDSRRHGRNISQGSGPVRRRRVVGGSRTRPIVGCPIPGRVVVFSCPRGEGSLIGVPLNFPDCWVTGPQHAKLPK